MTSESAYFARLSQELMTHHDEQKTLELICRRVLDVVGGARWASLTVRRRRGRLTTLASTDPLAAQADALQHELGEGPCLDSAINDRAHLVKSTANDARWPSWGPRAAELGIASMLSLQLSSDALDTAQDPLGAINVFAATEDAFDDVMVDRALVYAVHAANALSSARLVTTLSEAVSARHQVGIAQGLLMAAHDIDADRAFTRLQEYSSHRNLKLREVAREVVETGDLPERE
ncbi:GAF and ANTAR domain-containing protein [Nocardioides daejeonensis]|uniref:GAF and ANTAR domain-containing protein n=1 Tax=Nocardioides daejeonensis TaxID=1046556 RepID=UPI000D7455BA|nr:GAF and ANTAR domain-containing protein [Nocardioides daejeonensis]